jgi:hypothetical protein
MVFAGYYLLTKPKPGTVTGIFYAAESPSAVIDGQVVKEGDTIRGVKVVKDLILLQKPLTSPRPHRSAESVNSVCESHLPPLNFTRDTTLPARASFQQVESSR